MPHTAPLAPGPLAPATASEPAKPALLMADPSPNGHRPIPASTPAATTGTRPRIAQLRRFQWAVRATLTVGVAASVCANMLNARDNPISQAIAAWPPLALLLTVELVSRVPVHRRLLAIARIGGTAVIAGIAAYVSYFHMAAVVSRYGEHPPNPYLLPLSVDGLIVVASVSLVELSGRVRAALDRDAAPIEQAMATPTRSAPAAPDLAQAPPATHTRVQGHATTPVGRVGAPGPPPDQVSPVPPQPESKQADIAPTLNGHDDNEHDGNEHPPDIPLTLLPPAAPFGGGVSTDADPDLVALLPAARAARDELLRQGRSLSRDSLARQLRRRGHTIRTARVSDLLTLLKNDPAEPINGHQPRSSG